MHDADAAFVAALDALSLDMPRLVTITTRDGLVHRWTDSGREQTDGVETFTPTLARGELVRISYPTDGSPSTTAGTFPMGAEGFAHADVMAGRYDNATVIVQVKHAEVAAAVATIFAGFLSGGFDMDGAKRVRCSIQGTMALLGGRETHVLRASCPADFGRTRWPYRCPFPIADYTRAGTVTEVLGAAKVRVLLTGAGSDPVGRFTFGAIRFLDGALQYLSPPPTIWLHEAGATADEAIISFGWNLVFLPQVGDTCEVEPGCDRTFPTCADYSALVNDAAVFSSADYQGLLFMTGPDHRAAKLA